MKSVVFWPVLVVVVLLDQVTKAIAAYALPPNGFPQAVIGNGLRFALVYNPGAAFGLYLGSLSRWIFMALTGGALIILMRLYRQTSANDVLRALAITLVTAGALGNLIDRLRSDLGVVDFIDVGFGLHRWPTFNVADMAVSGGAFLLAWVLWTEDKRVASDAVVDTVVDTAGATPAGTSAASSADFVEPT